MATNKVASVKVQGLRELRKDLERLGDTEGSARFKQALQDAAKTVIADAKGNASTRMERSAAGRLKVSKGANAAAVMLGGKPYDLGAEFGAKRWHQFKPWRGNDIDAGYFLFPAVRDAQDELLDEFSDVIDDIWNGRSGGGRNAVDGLRDALGGGD